MIKSIVTHGRLLDFSQARVMFIINMSPDSFYVSHTSLNTDALISTASQALEQGADMLDLGACSTRPCSTPVSAEEEWTRLYPALKSIRSHFPDAIISVDTFHSQVAAQSIAEGADIINDVYGGQADASMFEVIAQSHVPYVLTHNAAIMQSDSTYDATTCQVLDFLQAQCDELHRRGVADVIIDPGFGFGKTMEENWSLLREMRVLETLHCPILVGISRKSMLYRPLGISPSESLNATTATHILALERGANILRVHDVRPAMEAIQIYKQIMGTSNI